MHMHIYEHVNKCYICIYIIAADCATSYLPGVNSSPKTQPLEVVFLALLCAVLGSVLSLSLGFAVFSFNLLFPPAVITKK